MPFSPGFFKYSVKPVHKDYSTFLVLVMNIEKMGLEKGEKKRDKPKFLYTVIHSTVYFFLKKKKEKKEINIKEKGVGDYSKFLSDCHYNK